MGEFKSMKFWIGDDPELSEKVQKLLLDDNYFWRHGGDGSKNTREFALYTNTKGRMTFSNSKAGFDCDNNEEINIDWMRTKKPETIELNGKTYVKSELEEALRHIKPVD